MSHILIWSPGLCDKELTSGAQHPALSRTANGPAGDPGCPIIVILPQSRCLLPPPPSCSPGAGTVTNIQSLSGLYGENTNTRMTFTQVGFDFSSLKFAVKMPKIKLRRPKILRRKRQNLAESSPDCSDPAPVTCAFRVDRKFESSGRSDQNSVSTDPSFTSDDWIKEFNARARYRSGSKLRKPSEDSAEEINFYANMPPSSHTSTPVSCRIVPLNRIENQSPETETRTKFLPDLSGIKIYETVELGSDGASDNHSSDDDYETVYFVNQKMTAKTLVRPPRSLKSGRR